MADRAAGSVAPRLAVAAVFFVPGLAVGTWAARIPALKDALHLSAGTLGLCLLGPAVGSVIAMPIAGAILATGAPRRVVQVAVVGLCVLQPVIGLVGAAWQLFVVLVFWGAGIGVADVAMNTEAAAVQERLGRHSMSRFHAAFSAGGLAGAGIGAAAAAGGVSVTLNFALVAAAGVALGLGGARRFGTRAIGHLAVPLGVRERLPQWSWTLAALAAMAFASFLCEGAADNWSAVYLHTSLHASPGLAALGYTGFACTMTAGRLVGDRLAPALGPVRLVRLSAGIAAASFAAALLIGRYWAGLVGFAVLGGGLSFVVPLVFSATSRIGRPGPNLAFATSCGYFGTLVGPPAIGGLAALTGLPAALGTIVVLSALITALAGAMRPRAWEPPVERPPAEAALYR